VAMAVDAMDKVRKVEMRDDPQAVAQALGTAERKTIKGLMWGMRKNPEGWSIKQTNAMHCLNAHVACSALCSAPIQKAFVLAGI